MANRVSPSTIRAIRRGPNLSRRGNSAQAGSYYHPRPGNTANQRPRPYPNQAGNNTGNRPVPYPKQTGNNRPVPYPKQTGNNPYPHNPNGQAEYPYPKRPKGEHHPRPRPPGVYIPGVITSLPGPVGRIPAPIGPAPAPRIINRPPNLGGGPPPVIPPAQFTRRPGTGVPPANEQRYEPNVIVTETALSQTGSLPALGQRHGLTRLQSMTMQLSGTMITRWRINDGRAVPAVVQAVEAEGSVMAVQPNYIASLQQTQGSRAVGVEPLEQYAPARLRLPEALALATGNRVLIAVIDSGADSTHPELAGLIVETFDAIGSGNPVHPHGTGIVGAITAHSRLTGSAPGARIIVARAFGMESRSTDGTTYSILRSLDWAASRGARIFNMSFAGPYDPAIERALGAANNRGIVLIAAAGNAGPRSPALYPAAYPNVIAVTATDENDRLFEHANRGRYISVAAPGVDLWLAAPGGEYAISSGTSFSAAIISGAVALMLERNPSLDPAGVRRILTSTARDLGPPGADTEFGAGLVDVYQAILRAAPAPGVPPTTVGSAPVARH